MARRKKGRAISGWLIVDKPLGVTSSAVVNKAKWAFDAQKAGHAGTLDPEATGVLAIAFGEATKTVPYVTDSLKAYRFTVRLGQATNTDDGEGEVVSESDKRPSVGEIRAAL
ncbi:MAG: tRNA pseudouridine(55) synthase TruB, partial [Alphaproteobacteria bacterium]